MLPSKRSAFSLIEMLVSVALITLLIGVAIFALKYQAMAINKTNRVGITKVLTYNQMRASLQSMKYYIVDNYDNLGYPLKELHPFFNGSQSSVLYITNNPLFSDDVALSLLECVGEELTYAESALYGEIDFLKPAIGKNVQKMTLLKNLQECSFAYYFEGRYGDSLADAIPQKIAFKFLQNNNELEFITEVKSDYNASIGEIIDAIYPTD